MGDRAMHVSLVGDAVDVVIGQRTWSLAIRGAKWHRTWDIRQLLRLQQDGIEMTVPEMAKLLKQIDYSVHAADVPKPLLWCLLGMFRFRRGREFQWTRGFPFRWSRARSRLEMGWT